MPVFRSWPEIERLLDMLAIVERRGPMTCKQICDAMGMTDTRGRHYVAHLRKLGALCDAGLVQPNKFSVRVQTYSANPSFDKSLINPPAKEKQPEPSKMRLCNPRPDKKMLTQWVGGNPFARFFA